MSNGTEEFGDKTNPCHLGLVDEHYLIIDKTNLTSYCLIHRNAVQHNNNCNMIYTRTSETYKTSTQKYIDNVKVVKLLLDNKDTSLEPIPFDEKVMNTQFYDKVRNTRQWNILHPAFSANTINQKKQPNIIKFISILKQLPAKHINRI